MARCTSLPVPALAKLISLGRALTNAISSLVVLTGSEGCTQMMAAGGPMTCSRAINRQKRSAIIKANAQGVSRQALLLGHHTGGARAGGHQYSIPRLHLVSGERCFGDRRHFRYRGMAAQAGDAQRA